MRLVFSYITIIFLTGVLLFSCDNKDALECFKKTGEITEEEFFLDPFAEIVVLDEADIYLQNGPDQKVYIKAGENLISDIHFNVQDCVLTISNKNRCNWVRTPGNPGIYIINSHLNKIEIYDYANFYTVDTLTLHKLSIFSDGTGNFDLLLKSDSLHIESIYISNFKFAGYTNLLTVLLTDDSRFNAKYLISDFNEINHRGSNLIELYPVKSLTGELSSTGSIHYYYIPEFIDMNVMGSGELRGFVE